MNEPDPKINEAIAFFEQMLQTMPGDRTSLEFLAVAYEQTGQEEKRVDCLIRLVDTLLREKDYDNAQSIAERLTAFKDVPAARAAVERVAELVQGQILKSEFRREVQGLGNRAEPSQGVSAPVFQDTSVEVHALSRSASAAEMDLVWLWKENECLPKEVCMDVLHVLTERPVTDTPMLISALALLDEQHPELTERVMEAMQRLSEVPPLPLELFEVQPAAAGLLAQAFIRVKGVLPFALFGNDVLVALLNPLNKELQDEVSSRLGKACHFFMAHPLVWQKAAEKYM